MIYLLYCFQLVVRLEVHFLQRNFDWRKCNFDIRFLLTFRGSVFSIHCQVMSWSYWYTPRQMFLKQMFLSYWVNNKCTLTRFTTQASIELIPRIQAVSFCTFWHFHLYSPSCLGQRYSKDTCYSATKKHHKLYTSRNSNMQIPRYKFWGALINYTGAAVVSNLHSSEPHAFSNIKHNTKHNTKNFLMFLSIAAT